MKLASLWLGMMLLAAPLGSVLAVDAPAEAGNPSRNTLHPTPKAGARVNAARAKAVGARHSAPAPDAKSRPLRVATTIPQPSIRTLRATAVTLVHARGAIAPATHIGQSPAMARQINRLPLASRASMLVAIGGPAAYDAKKGAVLRGTGMPRRR